MPTRRPSQGAYNKLERSMRARNARLVARLASGGIDVDGFHDRMLTILEDSHGRAAALGRQRAGDLSELNDDDRVYGAAVTDGENRFLTRFVQDLEGGRYDLDGGGIDEAAVLRRANLYAARLRGTTNETFVIASAADATFDWHLGPMESGSCEECPALAAEGPYTPETIPTYPGNGDTPCLFSCCCSLVRDDGINGFLPL